MNMNRIAILASGNGSNTRAIVSTCASGELPADIVLIVSNRRDAGVLDVARQAGIPHAVIDNVAESPVQADAAMYHALAQADAELVVLAGYLRLVGPAVLKAFAGRLVNIHPALLPRYGGKGMYGLRVHRAVIEAGEQETGVTIHLVEREYDSGTILVQRRLPVHADDTPETLMRRVQRLEHRLYPQTLAEILCGTIRLPA